MTTSGKIQNMAQPSSTGQQRRKFWLLFTLVFIFCLFFGWYALNYIRWPTPLPSDEKMIAHFEAHRAEFEELVHRYRTFIEREHWPELKWPSEEEAIQELWRQAKVYDVDYLSMLNWLPQPYTQTTARKVEEIRKKCHDDWENWHTINGEENDIPPPKCRLNGYRYGVLYFKPEPHNKFWRGSWRYSTVWKTYLHFPEPPKIEDGYLLGPMRTDGTYSYRDRVFSSLNYYPLRWKEYECVYRRIDPHWFIRLCNGH